MSYPEPSITVNVDVTNPGQFLACCGLLELADRLWPVQRDGSKKASSPLRAVAP